MRSDNNNHVVTRCHRDIVSVYMENQIYSGKIPEMPAYISAQRARISSITPGYITRGCLDVASSAANIHTI